MKDYYYRLTAAASPYPESFIPYPESFIPYPESFIPYPVSRIPHRILIPCHTP
ncbi:MAG: hypothetical protein QNL80_11945 [Akkermansiaceae bacterium]